MTHPLFTTSQARTANGALTNATSGSKVLDFFSICAASRGKDIKDVFNQALAEDRELALRALLWLRDVRGGAGEREQFRTLFATLPVADQLRLYSVVPEVGRWDDLLTAVDVLSVRNFILFALMEQGNGLAAKWMPRQGPVAGKLRKTVGMSAKEWRKLLVGLSNTVEQKMSAGNWSEINFAHVPSCASNLYRKAFNKHEAVRYQEYLTAVEKGEAKINASAIYPHDIVKSVMQGDAGSRTAEVQWKALPDYIGDNPSTFLPVVDVSGSMESAGVLQHAVALGIYLAERNKSVFKDHIISFSGNPNFHHIGTGTLAEKVRKVCRSGEDMSTNIQGVFDRLLTRAKDLKLSQADMPSHVLILSDMEFNSAGGWDDYTGGFRRNRSEKTNYQTVVAKFRAAGYEMPTLVFWNLFGRPGNQPVTKEDTGTMMISGFSPAIMKTVLSAKVVSPYDVMLEVLMNPRYDLGKHE